MSIVTLDHMNNERLAILVGNEIIVVVAYNFGWTKLNVFCLQKKALSTIQEPYQLTYEICITLVYKLSQPNVQYWHA